MPPILASLVSDAWEFMSIILLVTVSCLRSFFVISGWPNLHLRPAQGCHMSGCNVCCVYQRDALPSAAS